MDITDINSYLTGDGGVRKMIIKNGQGQTLPFDETVVEIKYTAKIVDGEEFESTVSSNPLFKFRIGKGEVIKGLDHAVRSMKKKEKSKFRFSPEYGYGDKPYKNVPPNSELEYEIELIDFSIKSDHIIESYDYDNILENSDEFKQEGIEAYQNKEYQEAFDMFDVALDYLSDVKKRDVNDEINDRKFTLLINMSNCTNLLKEYQKTINQINDAVKIKETPKCFYHRGIAFCHLNKFPEAKNDFEKLKELIPGDPTVDYCFELLEFRTKSYKPPVTNQIPKRLFKIKLYEDKAKIEEEKKKKEEEEKQKMMVSMVPKKIDKKNPQYYIDISENFGQPKRIVFELFYDFVPKTCENFMQLCKGTHPGKSYLNTNIFKIKKKAYIQLGDYEFNTGKGGKSIYGDAFDDENFHYRHTRDGLLSMANTGKNTNRSQFMITLSKLPEYDNKNVVFGKVIKGLEAVFKVGNLAVNDLFYPYASVQIVECGEMRYYIE